MSRRLAAWILGLVLVAAVGLALAGPLARWLEDPPSLAKAARSYHAQDHDAAEAELARFLERNPEHREGNLLMAQVLIDRPSPRPRAALECLARIRSRYPLLRATVLVAQGKAYAQLHRHVDAENAWSEALRLQPDVPEAGWLLIQQYYVQGRDAEARALALRLHPRETDDRDRVRYLLELVREDVERLAAAGVIPILEQAVAVNPADTRSARALGRALVKEGRGEEGFALLRKALAESPTDRDGWNALLAGLADAGEVDALAEELGKLPPGLTTDPLFRVHRGRVAQERGRAPEAVEHFAEALRAMPDDPRLIFRMARALRLAGRAEEAKVHEAREADIKAALEEQKGAYKEASGLGTLGLRPEPRLYQRLADLRERLGHADEALAWHRLVLRDAPANPVSMAAVERLSRREPSR